ncbi:MAG TPA: tRNA uracil 4-sulfurtransferase ThiI [Vicinamibacterales bacterium]|nr:tRNA uracil 4-sulfurtransferase ThiI [Vicinamibacterales bacterium]
MTSILVHYSEVALKGKNRSWFVGRLVRNIHGALAGLHVKEVRTPIGRIEIVLGQDSTLPDVMERLSRVFGIANYAVARHVPRDFEGMAEAIVSRLPPKEAANSFRVFVRRADQKFTTPSPDLARDLGSRVWTARGWRVDLDHADLVISVEIIPGTAYCYVGREPGPGGLPMGTGGRLVALLSGGIDSPVAAWRMMRRGCYVTFVHFHSAPFLSTASQEKARRLATLLTQYQLRSKLYLVPFGELQREITVSVPGDLRVIVYRRMMLRIAQRIARDVRARALVTGDVVGQVASQTLDNMTAIDRASHMTILRPLVGMDKEEIIATAQKLGTFDISILPDQDTCTLFTPRHPETHAHRRTIDQAEQTLPVETMVNSAVSAAVVEQLTYPCKPD